MTSTPAARPPTDVDRIADGYLERLVELDPAIATVLGVAGRHDAFGDLSPDGLAELAALRATVLAQLSAAQPADLTDRVTVAALGEDLRTTAALRELGDDERDLNILTSPQETVRMVFDLMPTATDEDWATIARRMAAVPDALAGYVASLRHAAAAGRTPARRQVEEVAQRVGANTGPDGFFAGLAARGPEPLAAELAAGARRAGEAYEQLQRFLREELHPRATGRDAYGRERYAVHLRHHLGAEVDLDETYAWGQEELARLRTEMADVAARITPGADVRAVMAELDADPRRQLHGTNALQAWMQQRSDAAVAALAGTHFDIPEPLRRLECLIAPTTSGGVYYTAPSDDFSRPGRMWWSVPPGHTRFSTWKELTSVYHEGVPGHHLQIGQAVLQRATLNRWRRLLAGPSGFTEGWALYAERLMAELGHLDDPAERLGMLDAQTMRAARVVLDVGVHCELPMPGTGAPWTFERATQFFAAHSAWDEGNRRFEVLRYYGWGGQAPTYKLGERLWRQLRDDVAARQAARGEPFDVAAFHREALGMGAVGLDVLRGAVLGGL